MGILFSTPSTFLLNSTHKKKTDIVKVLKNEYSNKWFKFINFINDEYLGHRTSFYMFISNNPNITIEIIRNNINACWDWYELTYCNENITSNDISENPDMPWDFTEYNGKITCILRNTYCVAIVKLEHQNEWHQSWSVITIKEVLNNPERNWSYIYLFTQNFDMDRTYYVKRGMKNILLTQILSKKQINKKN